MNLTFENRGIIHMEGARLVYRNFEGRGDKFNREGNRNFSVIIDTEEQADALVNDVNEFGVGWNVKAKPPRDENEGPFLTLPVKIKFNDHGPAVWFRAGDNADPVKLTEEEVTMLDRIDIADVELFIRPYDDVISGKPFRAAYLQSICVTQDLSRDPFAARFARRGE